MEFIKTWAVILAVGMIISGLGLLTVGSNTEPVEITYSDVGEEVPMDTPATGLVRTVLIEQYTHATCTFCPLAEANLIPVLYNYTYSKVAPVMPHVMNGADRIYQNSTADAFARKNYYSLSGVPHTAVDGIHRKHPINDPEYGPNIEYVEYALGQLSPYLITSSGDLGTETVSAVIEAHEVIPPNSDRYIRFMFWENNIDVIPRLGDQGQYFDTYHWAMWDMLDDALGEQVFPAGANPGDKAWFNRTFTIGPEYVLSELGVTIFVQDDTTHKVDCAIVEDFQPDPPLPSNDIAVCGFEVGGNPMFTVHGPPNVISAGDTVAVNGTVCNFGLGDESSLQVDLLVNGLVDQSQIVDFVESGHGEKVGFNWSVPAVAGGYQVGMQVSVVGGETNVSNNIVERTVTTKLFPIIWPETFNINEFVAPPGGADFDNITIRNDGLADLALDISPGERMEIMGSWDYITSSITTYNSGLHYGVTTAVELVEIKFYFVIAGNVDIHWFVYEGNALSGSHNLVSSVNTLNPPLGEGWYSSGPISVNMIPGKYYMIGISWTGSSGALTYGLDDELGPQPVSFGTMEGKWYNKVPIPPPASVSAGCYRKNIYKHALVTKDGTGDWLSATPETGSIVPAGQTDIMLTADATSLSPGVYNTNLCIYNSDPNDPVFNCPVTFTVAAGASYDIPINIVGSGWEFISFPLGGVSGDVITILDDTINGDSGTTWDQVQWFDAQTQEWKTYATFKPAALNNMPVMDNTMGVWVHVTSNSGDNEITIGELGAYPSSAVYIDLYTGWNLVGYPSAMARFPSMTLPPEADMVAFYDNAQPYDIIDLPVMTVQQMQEGNAYWVRVTADCIWQVNP